MLALDHVREALRREMPHLRAQYHVETLGLFGSYVRGEQQAESDLDVLVSFSQPPTLFELARLQFHLEDVLGIRVDVVLRDGLRPYVAPYVLREVEYV